MSEFVILLEDASGKNREISGNKAAALADMIKSGINVPPGACVTTESYRAFVDSTGLRDAISMELSRKRFEDMRWEEMWDASLRLRNMFLATDIPQELEQSLRKGIASHFGDEAVAVRSSSLAEDAAGASFAGLHDSYLNINGIDSILKHIKLVWASLWSDAALLYRQELSLDIDTSAMSVIIQRMIYGQKSGISFGVNPNDSKQAVIESVYGLNKGLVDGDIEPDRWFLDRKTGDIISGSTAEHEVMVVPSSEGVRFENIKPGVSQQPVLTESEVRMIFCVSRRLEDIHKAPQDIEWTIKDGILYLLQSRPVTSVSGSEENGQKSWYLSLRRSFDNLKKLGERIEKVLIPAMIEEADEVSRRDLSSLSDSQIAEEISSRKALLGKWHDIYWDEFIPFAHGMRLFGQIYNDRMKPSDPYEFVNILTSSSMESVKRNEMLESMADALLRNKSILSADSIVQDSEFLKMLDDFVERFSGLTCSIAKCEDERNSVLKLLTEMAKHPKSTKNHAGNDTDMLAERFLASFRDEEQDYARELIELARKSYRIRDDDNIYMGRFESNLVLAVEESRRRLGERCKDEYVCANPDEVIQALKFEDYEPKRTEPQEEKPETEHTARQLRGQPAGQGIAKGKARVVINTSDLFDVKQDEILVCDAIDPNMTFVIPLVSAIVERRGGMLIHGAIIAREYGLPCVTGIPQAIEFIKTGDYITVDGYYGIVIIHSDEEKRQDER